MSSSPLRIQNKEETSHDQRPLGNQPASPPRPKDSPRPQPHGGRMTDIRQAVDETNTARQVRPDNLVLTPTTTEVDNVKLVGLVKNINEISTRTLKLQVRIP